MRSSNGRRRTSRGILVETGDLDTFAMWNHLVPTSRSFQEHYEFDGALPVRGIVFDSLRGCYLFGGTLIKVLIIRRGSSFGDRVKPEAWRLNAPLLQGTPYRIRTPYLLRTLSTFASVAEDLREVEYIFVATLSWRPLLQPTKIVTFSQ